MYTLGIHGGIQTYKHIEYATPINWLHDAAAVLCNDGVVVAASEEERFTRLKHATLFPLESIRFCLDTQNIGLASVDRIVLTSQHMNTFLEMSNTWRFGTKSWLHENRYSELAAAILSEEFGDDVRPRLSFAGHHMSHAMSAAWQSGFSQCLCVVLDGWGDGHTGLIASFRDGSLNVLRPLHNTGPAAMYLAGTLVLGYDQFDEYKVMGLAPYGKPDAFRHIFESNIQLREDGEFEISDSHCGEFYSVMASLPKMRDSLLPEHKNFAAALQSGVEVVVMHLLRHFRAASGHEDLCMSGGFAHNSTANGKILASRIFKHVFVDPAPHDAGCAIGAALLGYVECSGSTKSRPTRHVYWGKTIPSQTVALLRDWEAVIDVEMPTDIHKRTAALLAEGKIVAWVQGRAEFGARALGNRSIVADPRPAQNRELINAMIKKREAFRPFAPTVMEEHLHEYFDVPAEVKSLPFMAFVVQVKEQYRKILGAVTHVDGSARVQSVSALQNATFWKLLDAFLTLTGIPILLNTSFNNAFEPIVNTVEDALNCFLSTELDYLVVGDALVRKKQDARESRLALLRLLPNLAMHVSLTHCRRADGNLEARIHDRYRNTHIAVSESTYAALLTAAEKNLPFSAVLGGLEKAEATRTIEELVELWSRRLFTCKGATVPAWSVGDRDTHNDALRQTYANAANS